MKRNQTFHETLIPLLVEGIGAESYLEFGTHKNETIGKVKCPRRIGVDVKPVEIPDVTFFSMTTQEFIEKEAAALAPFEFVFIDANHSAEEARRNLQGIMGFVADEGLVLLHDTNPQTEPDTAPGYCGDSWKLALYLVGAGMETVTLPFHPGITIVRKRVKWGPEK